MVRLCTIKGNYGDTNIVGDAGKVIKQNERDL